MRDKDSETLILVDDEGNKIGHENRVVCHTGKGKRHLAFVVLLTTRNQFLIQKRKHKIFDGLWDVSCTSHPIALELEKGLATIYEDETTEEAAQKCMKYELGVTTHLKKIGAFNYFAQDGDHCENEHCVVLIGNIKDDPEPNPEEIYEIDYISLVDIVYRIESNPEEFTPWLKHTVDLLKQNVSHLGS
ncbi:MAG: NUDIX domain-containing protein [Candidatus Aenigmarchaeota archaeon]|nr:NUDIX domain-containing protein [Candidatus Aenigmarchaeota archaeon]